MENVKNVLVDCHMTWSNWSHCNTKCGGGSKYRTKIIKNYPQYGGRNCPMKEVGRREMENCNEDPCPGKKLHLKNPFNFYQHA